MDLDLVCYSIDPYEGSQILSSLCRDVGIELISLGEDKVRHIWSNTLGISTLEQNAKVIHIHPKCTVKGDNEKLSFILRSYES